MEQETRTRKPLKKTWWFWVVIGFAIVVVLFFGAVLADWIVYYGEVHAGITVNGVYLRGKDEEQATIALQRLVDSAEGPIILTGGGKSWTVAPSDLDRAIDLQGAVRQAMAITREGNFFENLWTRFSLYRHGRDLPLAGAVDSARLDALIADIALDLHVAPQNAGLRMENGTVKVIPGVMGRDVNTAPLRDQVESLFLTLHPAETLEIPLITKKPDVQEEYNQPALRQAELMMGAPVTLTSHEKTWTVTPEQLASWLDFQTDWSTGVPTLVPYLSEGAMWSFLTGLAPEVYREPVDARLTSPDGKTIEVIPDVPGETFEQTATAEALDEAAGKTTGRIAEVVVTGTEADFTTADAKEETFNDKLSTFTTKYSCPANRRQNVRITTEYATNVLLAPGQEYNFDKQIGPRTPERGYKLAPGIVGPNQLEDVYGGGICQVSTTMFNAVFFAGLKVTERHNHSIFINHYPLGRDATVTDGGKNLRFVNDTDHYIWIKGESDGVTTTITIWGTSDGRKVDYSVGKFYNVRGPSTVTTKDPTLPEGTTKVVDSGQTGRSLKTYRTVTLPDGTVIHDDTFTSVWPAYPKEVVVGTKPAT